MKPKLKAVAEMSGTVKQADPVQVDIEDGVSDNARMYSIAEKHLAAQSPSNDPETSLMRVFINLINKGFDEKEVTALIMQKAKGFGLVK